MLMHSARVLNVTLSRSHCHDWEQLASRVKAAAQHSSSELGSAFLD